MTEETHPPIEHPLTPMPTAVIVGASSGIGAALARKLAQEGYKLALLARRAELLDSLCGSINAMAGKTVAIAYPHDVANFSKVPTLFHRILQEMKGIDVFIYNAGVLHTIGMSEFDFEKDLDIINVNLLGAMAWLDQAATLFDRMGSGQLVGISSVAGDRGRVANPPYNAAKAGFSTYLEALRNRLTRKGVHVLTVKPGYVKTAMMAGVEGKFPVATPERVAKDIWRAIKRRKQGIYTPWWWRYILLIVQHIPSFIFRRLSF